MGEVATVEIDERGRLVVPKAVRKTLGINGKEAVVRVEVDVRDPKEAE